MRLLRARPTTARRPGALPTSPPSSTPPSRSRPRSSPHELLNRAKPPNARSAATPPASAIGDRVPSTSTSSLTTTSSYTTPILTLPHPYMFERAFVLVPLAEIAPDRIIAGIRMTRCARTRRCQRHRKAARGSARSRGTPFARRDMLAPLAAPWHFEAMSEREDPVAFRRFSRRQRASNGAISSTPCSRAHRSIGWRAEPMMG